MKNIKQKIVNFCLNTNIWLFLIPLLSIFSVMTFFIIPNLQQQIGGGELLDTKFNRYNLIDVSILMEQLGEAGRSTYLYLELFADIPFIIFYVITFTIFIIRLLVKNKIKSQILFFIAFLPLLAGIFDFLEDTSIINMLLSYPIISSKTICFSSSTTILKGYFLTLTIITLFLNFIIFLLKKIKR
ncbi:hypothetical protein RM51_13560 [Chryseobacterium taiwanense]|uniref:Uncharacterized protein n=1 Tax=Chryseobacterium taiwanense TaxID=363331 RepID=A0A0B4DCY6_9FLAO|nr:hypothetical protein RM51_13560 [Chryseobacterium taiwanense]